MKQQINYIISELRGFYPEEELRELAYWILEESTGMTRTEILFGCKDTKKNVYAQEIEVILQKLRAHEPIQYVFGHTEWMGLDLRVTPATLIPRPETAELVEWVLHVADKNKPLRVLDIGTGSGCIAIALKKAAPNWQVTGLDISHEALDVAKENAERNNVTIHWQQADILSLCSLPMVDIIVSNPPYICEKEKVDMQARVLDYEPARALFVPDNDPLLFYRKIASLKGAPILFFEINEAYGEQVCSMLRTIGYTNVELKKDMYGKTRMVFGRLTK
ncbi:MAG: peptide chain release factor N(5)-glutamine methyltransferase [Paludibacteraceae bacterium]|nr:peptide chain release factor N(5)-glutamine methyltransferase [Paludibacteraceae bacterium]